MKRIIWLLLVVMVSTLFTIYTQLYTQDSPNTATKGIIFTQTLNLKEYRNVSNGLGAWGYYDRYTRSDRHDEVITVYCNKYCKK